MSSVDLRLSYLDVGISSIPIVGLYGSYRVAKIAAPNPHEARPLPVEIRTAIRKTIAKTAACHLAGCAVTAGLGYLLFATLFKVSVVTFSILLGVSTFFIAPAVIVLIYALYEFCCYRCYATDQVKKVPYNSDLDSEEVEDSDWEVKGLGKVYSAYSDIWKGQDISEGPGNLAGFDCEAIRSEKDYSGSQ